VLVRFAAALATVPLGAVAVVLALLLIQRTPGPTSAAPSPTAPPAAPAASTRPAPASAPSGFPAPPAGAVVFSRQQGRDALALAVLPHGSRLLLQASVLGPEGHGVKGLAVRFGVAGRASRAVACGAGCYRATLTSRGRPREVVVDVRGGGAPAHWRVALPRQWPAPDATKLMAQAGAAWRSLRSLSYLDRLAAGPGQEVTTRWRIVAPDRVAYDVSSGGSAVIIGSRRWDRPQNGKWIESLQEPPLQQPLPFWAAVSNAHLLGSGRLRGRPVWDVSFFDPVTPAWFDVRVDKATHRVLDLRMITTAHFMHDTYGSFNGPVEIEPPR